MIAQLLPTWLGVLLLVVAGSMLVVSLASLAYEVAKALRAFWERLVSPGCGICRRCRRPWRFVEPHVVYYSNQAGAFALCEGCWAISDADTRWSAMYRAHGHQDTWNQINKVLVADE